VPLSAEPPNPLAREMVGRPLETGVRAIDGTLTFGRGQRVGIFAGSGVGKSTLLGMIARQARADVNVIALLGERGREVREFIEHSLGPEGLARSVLVVATGDQAALVRRRGALVATAIAEYFRDQGKEVLLMVDSVTRVAMAWREIGLAVGEPPTTKGYPPSVFAALPRLLERAGNGERGGITGIYTVLVDGDDFNEPVADAARSILDGHVVLTRKLAAAGHFPAIDVLDSKSRVRDQIVARRAAAGGQPAAQVRGGVPREGGPDPRRRLPEGERPDGRRRGGAARALARLPPAAARRDLGLRAHRPGRCSTSPARSGPPPPAVRRAARAPRAPA
jgi:FliI/YscN family ATPase